MGRGCEFASPGPRACGVLRAGGLGVPLVTSNPATIMTDPEFADATYVEPITPEFVEAVIARERPDALLPTPGGAAAPDTAAAPPAAGGMGEDPGGVVAPKPSRAPAVGAGHRFQED